VLLSPTRLKKRKEKEKKGKGREGKEWRGEERREFNILYHLDITKECADARSLRPEPFTNDIRKTGTMALLSE
jgi:hypothetical protein